MTTFGTGTRTWSRDPGARTAPGYSVAAGTGWRTPEEYGAVGDGISRPAGAALGLATLADLQVYFPFADAWGNELDYLAIQAALYAGGVVIGRPGARYVVNHTLVHPNGRVQADFNHCDLIFEGMQAAADDGTNLLDNALSGPSNTLLGPRVDWVFGGGTATFTDGAKGDPTAHFGQFGWQVPLSKGRWTVEATVTITEGASAGFYGPPYIGFAFFADQVGQGALEWPDALAKSVTLSPGDDGVPTTISFDFEVTEEGGRTLWLTFSGGNADISVDLASVRIKPFLMNYALWVTGDPIEFAAGGYEYDESVWVGGQFLGPNSGYNDTYSGPPIDGVLHKNFRGDGPRCSFRESILLKFRRGIVMSDHAYLMRHDRVKVGYSQTCATFLAGATNAGENLNFLGCILFNSELAVDAAGGGEWFFTGCSWDYCRRFLAADRGAYIVTDTQHIEGRHNAAGDLLFDIRGASMWAFPSGEILLAGADHEGEDHIGRVESNADQIAFGSVWLYNLLTASGTTWTGAGRVTVERHMGPTNPLLARLWLENHASDAHGGMGDFTNGPASDGLILQESFPADAIGLDCHLHAVGTRAGRLSFGPSGPEIVLDTGVARVTDGASLRLDIPSGYGSGQACNLRVLIPVRNGKIVLDRYYLHKPDVLPDITHPAYTLGTPAENTASIITVDGFSTVTIAHDYADGLSGAGVQPGWTVAFSGLTGSFGGIAASALNGTHTIADVTETGFTIDVGTEATATATTALTATATITYTQTNFLLWDRRLWVRVGWRDADGVPVIVQDQYAGESNYNVDFGAVSWMLGNPEGNRWWYTERVLPDDDMDRIGSGRAPEWATHMLVDINFWNFLYAVSTPPAPPIHLAGFFANVV